MMLQARGVMFAALHAAAFIGHVHGNVLRRAVDTATFNETGLPPCDALISAGLTERILLATSESYEPTVESWFNGGGRQRPWCFFQPRTTQEVSDGIVALNKAGSGAGHWHIAVRAGGHGTPGTNNIDYGVTIDLSMMNSSTYDPSRNIAMVSPGARWGNVYKHLHEHDNVMVTGGRDGSVGVGGFLLGGGNSFFTGRNGFACDTVINWEVVLANGTVVNANAHQNPDLWKALKGGGSNFGLVTRMDLETMPAKNLAHGERIVTANASDDVIGAIVDFTDRSMEAPADHMFAMYSHSPDVDEDYAILLTTANTQGDLNTSSFDKFNQIPAVSESWGAMPLEDAAAGGGIPDGLSGVQSTLTFLNERHNLEYAADLHAELVKRLSASIGKENFLTAMFFQPFPTYFAEIGQKKGGNVLGLDRIPGNAILWVFSAAVTNGDAVAVSTAQAELTALATKMKQYMEEHASGADWIYSNYADLSQNPLGSSGPESVAFMKEVAERYDPEGFWQHRVPGGFKLSRVDA